MFSKVWKLEKLDFAVVLRKKKFNRLQFVTVFCTLMESNKKYAEIT